MTRHQHKMILIYFLLCLGACKNFKEKLKDQKPAASIESSTSDTSLFPYDLKKIDQTFILNKALREISGLAYDMEAKKLLAINDELGKVYYLDTADGNIEKEIRFGKKGDYEGVIKIDKLLYAVKSNGYLHEYNLETEKSKIYKTSLSSINEVEGLTYEKEKNQLLLACKGKSNDKNLHKKSKVIYSIDTDSFKIKEEPHITISDTTLLALISKRTTGKLAMNKLKTRTRLFSPSGISIHPHTGEYYILSARGSTLVICDKNRVPVEIIFMNEKIIPQPEGICFDSSGNLFIATEGKGFSGKIFRFSMQ